MLTLVRHNYQVLLHPTYHRWKTVVVAEEVSRLGQVIPSRWFWRGGCC